MQPKVETFTETYSLPKRIVDLLIARGLVQLTEFKHEGKTLCGDVMATKTMSSAITYHTGQLYKVHYG